MEPLACHPDAFDPLSLKKAFAFECSPKRFNNKLAHHLAMARQGRRLQRVDPLMEYCLSFCKIIQISDHLFEIFVDEGINVDGNCAREELEFWTELRTEPFDLLLNCTKSFSYDFAGATEIGKSPLQRRLAVLVYNNIQYSSNSMAIEINRIQMPKKIVQIFSDRESAIAWLDEPFKG